MSIEFHEPTPELREEPLGLDIKIEKSLHGKNWIFSFKTDNPKERSVYKNSLETSIKLEAFHAERVSKDDDIEQRWEVSGIPPEVEGGDFQKIVDDIQARAIFNLQKKLAA